MVINKYDFVRILKTIDCTLWHEKEKNKKAQTGSRQEAPAKGGKIQTTPQIVLERKRHKNIGGIRKMQGSNDESIKN